MAINKLPTVQDIEQDRERQIESSFRTLDNLFSKPVFSQNLYQNNLSQIGQRFQEAQNNLNTYFSQAEGNVNNSFNRGMELLNQNFSQAIQGISDIAEPYRQSSLMAQKEYQNLLGLGDKTFDQINQDLMKTPGYQFQFQQGQQAIERSAAAKGMSVSGNTLTELQQFGQGLAQSTYQDRLGNLLGLMNSTSPILAQLAGTQAQLQAGLGEAQLGAETQRGSILGQLGAERGTQLAGLSQNQLSMEQQLAQDKRNLEAQQQMQREQLRTGYLQSTDVARQAKEAQIGAAGLQAAATGASAGARADASNRALGYQSGYLGG